MSSLLKYEKDLWSRGINLIAGVDEAGRGPLAGPIVISAVVLKKEDLILVQKEIEENQLAASDNPRNNDLSTGRVENLYRLINDSKKIPEKKREILYEFIITKAINYSIVEISSLEIDEKGIGWANKSGFQKAIKNLQPIPEYVLTDHFPIMGFDQKRQTNITKGDALSINIAAASILAKVHRDRLMRKLSCQFPAYGFDRHKGYGTKAHMEAIYKYGPCIIHRKSFEPIKSMYN